MERIIINNGEFKNLRFNREHFSFTESEERFISDELDRLECMLAVKGGAVFSVSKYDGLYSGTLKIESLDIFEHCKDISASNLFRKLWMRVENDILVKNKIRIDLVHRLRMLSLDGTNDSNYLH